MSSDPEVLSAIRRSERAWCEQVCEWESTEWGVAFSSPRFPSLPEWCQVHDVWLADSDPVAVYDAVESYYSERNLTCRAWLPGSGQAVEPVADLLEAKGWLRQALIGMVLPQENARDDTACSSIRVLPARAMRKAYRKSLEEDKRDEPDYVEAGFERLDDANHDAFLAMAGEAVLGRLSYLEVGDIARLIDFKISETSDAPGVEHALMAHFLQLARRLRPRLIVAALATGEVPTQDALKRAGFVQSGKIERFVR